MTNEAPLHRSLQTRERCSQNTPRFTLGSAGLRCELLPPDSAQGTSPRLSQTVPLSSSCQIPTLASPDRYFLFITLQQAFSALALSAFCTGSFCPVPCSVFSYILASIRQRPVAVAKSRLFQCPLILHFLNKSLAHNSWFGVCFWRTSLEQPFLSTNRQR